MPSAKFFNAQSLTKFLSKSFAFLKNHDRFLPDLKLKFSVFINIYTQDYVGVNVYVTIKVTMTSLFPSRGRSSCETLQLHRLPTKTFVSTARRRSWFCRTARRETKVSAAANVSQRSPLKDGETQPGYSVASSNRRFSSPSGEKGDIRVRQLTDARPSRSRRRTDNFQAAEDFINWYVGISC